MALTHSEAYSILESYLPFFHECIIGAWKDFCKWSPYSPHLITPRTRANIMHDFMTARARNKVNGTYGIRVHESGGLFLLIIEDKINIKFKKLNEDKRPSNIPTQQSLYFMEQMELPGIPFATNLVVGYELNKLQTDISAVSIICPLGIKNDWFFDIDGEIPSDEIEVIEIPIPPTIPIIPFKLREEIKKSKVKNNE